MELFASVRSAERPDHIFTPEMLSRRRRRVWRRVEAAVWAVRTFVAEVWDVESVDAERMSIVVRVAVSFRSDFPGEEARLSGGVVVAPEP